MSSEPKNEIKGDDHVPGQPPMSRRDALKAVGLAGAAALSAAVASPVQAADAKPGAVPAGNPMAGAGWRDHVTEVLPADVLSRQQQHLLPGPGADRPRRNADLLHRQHADSGHKGAGRHLHHGRTGNGKKFFFDFGSGCMRNIIAMAYRYRRSTISSSPISTSITTRTFPTSSPRAVDGALEAVARPWPSGRTPRDGIST